MKSRLWKRSVLLTAVAATITVLTSLAVPAHAGTRIAQIAVKGSLTEHPGGLELSLLNLGNTGMNLRDVTSRIRRASEDGRVDALLLTIGDAEFGTAQAEEIRQALVDFRKTGKRLYVHAESLTMVQYAVASAADVLVMLPTSELNLRGMSVELMHYKGLMDKVGLEADFVRSGKYKSAIEPMIQREPSPATLEMMNKLLDDVYATIVGYIAAGRKLEPEAVKKLIDAGPYTAEEALAARLIDRAAALEEFKKILSQEAGGEMELMPDYGAKKAVPDIDFDNPFALFKLLGKLLGGKDAPKDNAPKVALVYAEGPIVSGQGDIDPLMGGKSIGSDTFNAAMREAREDRTVKAVVIRIDSPGGSATASEAMWREIRLTAEKKRVIVSMGNTAASGGYYIASAGEIIVAEPTTITGSIGVFGGKLVLAGVYQKLDVTVTTLKRGQNATVYSSTSKFSDSERAVVERHIRKVYDTFLDRVATGRSLDKNKVHELAQGRVWTGLAAKELGLVDELGGLDRALAIAREKAGIRDPKILVLPKPRNPLDELMKLFGGDLARTTGAAVQMGLVRQAFSASPEVRAFLQTLPRPTAQLVSRMLLDLVTIEREHLLMVGPTFDLK